QGIRDYESSIGIVRRAGLRPGLRNVDEPLIAGQSRERQMPARWVRQELHPFPDTRVRRACSQAAETKPQELPLRVRKTLRRRQLTNDESFDHFADPRPDGAFRLRGVPREIELQRQLGDHHAADTQLPRGEVADEDLLVIY